MLFDEARLLNKHPIIREIRDSLPSFDVLTPSDGVATWFHGCPPISWYPSLDRGEVAIIANALHWDVQYEDSNNVVPDSLATAVIACRKTEDLIGVGEGPNLREAILYAMVMALREELKRYGEEGTD